MERLRDSFEDAPVIEKDGGYEYVVLPISNGVPMLEPALLREVVVGVTRVAELGDMDKIVTPEAMGIHISTAVSLQTDIPLTVVRKREYGLPGEVSLHQETGYSEGEMYLNDVEAGDRVLVLDDLLSTGGTLRALTDALDDVGAEVADVVVVIRKVGSESAMADSPHDVSALVDIEVEDGAVEVVAEYR
ncbi:hypoxanthine/guanine phosphoribosyltransferase [Halobacterium wangiae]|uniref:hypoxanthine/guanine phosphoribosyltransferase n=1 Tax=Halobacterium wangiae TaxID=2902623 RepID=UPI001E4EB736|nr:hypoxanthine/guanine phosphoribosyltransferase [Halobacterium wangiae]